MAGKFPSPPPAPPTGVPIPYPNLAAARSSPESAMAELLRLGVSAGGAQQLLGERMMTSYGDRTKIARVIILAKDTDIGVENDETHVRGRTETVNNNESIKADSKASKALRQAGFSAPGIQQCLKAQPVTNESDRQRLAVLISEILA